MKKRLAHPRMGRTLQLLVVAATTSAFVPREAPSRPPPPLYANGERRRYYRQRFMGFLRLGRMAATSRETRPEAPLPPPASPAPEAPRVEHGEKSDEKGALTFRFGNWFTPKYKFDVEDRETHYGVLGLERTASPSEIKRNYRGLSRTCHPDVDPSEAGRAKWAAVTEAYETLRDERKREAYDGALAVNDLAESTEQFVDDVVVPFVRDKAAPVLGGFASAFGQTAQSFVDKARGGNISAASAVATAAGFAVAGPVGAIAAAAAATSAEQGASAPAVLSDLDRTLAESNITAATVAATAAGFAVAGPVGAAAAAAAERAASFRDDAGAAAAERAASFRENAGFRRDAPEPRRASPERPRVVVQPGLAAQRAKEFEARRAAPKERPKPPTPSPPATAPVAAAAATPKPPKPPPAAEPDAAEAAPEDLDSLSRSELRRKLLRQGLNASGSKVELIRRVRDLGL